MTRRDKAGLGVVALWGALFALMAAAPLQGVDFTTRALLSTLCFACFLGGFMYGTAIADDFREEQ